MELSRKRTRILPVVFSLITLSLFLVGAAQAATFCVSDAAGLHNALSQAASDGEDDIIQIMQGTYVGNFIYASTEAFGVTIEGGYTVGCASREVDPANTVLDGNATGNVLVSSCPDHAAEFVVDGVTLQDRNASNEGGGLFAKTDNGGITLTNNTITENSAGEGGGVHVYLYNNSDTANIYNNIIYNNTASDGNDLYIENDYNDDFVPSIVNLYNNDFDQSASGTYIQIPFPIDPSNLDNLDPLFVGATSGDYHLIGSSPCIDAGDNSAPALPETDKDGQPRLWTVLLT